MWKIIRADLHRYGTLTNLLKGLKEPGYRFLFFHRNVSKHKPYSLLGLMYRRRRRRRRMLIHKYGSKIPINTEIGEGFFIGHFGTIVRNDDVKIGKNRNIAHTTTIGQANKAKLQISPAIRDNVWIESGTKLAEKIRILSNILKTPKTFLNIDVPNNSLVLNYHVKIIEKENPTQGYINNIYKT
ncbi:hypothetical protein [Algibacter luteus]|uniref:Serine O-acetyltransferase n=1 Tax=Algibacter luteus TaxID=1178825 RepID=A0A1M6GQV2_9FLAO|nr:hypothetical protein [Algibacter luteus]SHJ12278.1 serine O-acetyltransferase [Algibacter luteus]